MARGGLLVRWAPIEPAGYVRLARPHNEHLAAEWQVGALCQEHDQGGRQCWHLLLRNVHPGSGDAMACQGVAQEDWCGEPGQPRLRL
eukprot:9791233-Lingulodinium_polyedra.AAC.1